MKCVKVDLGAEKRDIKIYPFFDVHLGSPKCDIKKLLEDVKTVEKDPDAYAILGGDLINNSTTASVGDTYAEDLTPMEQMKLAINTFSPIKDKIIGIVSGNHEARSYKADGIDLTYFLANEFKVTERYDPTACLLFVRFGNCNNVHKGGAHTTNKICYTIYFAHGTGQGGKFVSSKALGLQRRADIIPDADIVITGHTHAPITFKECHYDINYGNSSVKLKETTFVNTSSYVLHEQYAENMGMKPSSSSNPIINLCGSQKRITVSL